VNPLCARRTGNSSLTISAKPDGVGAASQRFDRKGRTIWIADAHRDDGKRYVLRCGSNSGWILASDLLGTSRRCCGLVSSARYVQ